jgi:hypothetical protein
MADNKKLTEKTELLSANPTDILYIVHDVAGTPVGRKISVLNLVGAGTDIVKSLIEWAEGEDYQVTSANYDSDNVVTTGSVVWPDESLGTFTVTSKNSTFLAIDAYTISHTTSGKTVTQTTVTRDSNGNITVKPTLTVA